MKYFAKLACLFALAAFVGCTTGATTAPNITQANPFAGKLQFAVGTANIYGSGSPSLNVVSTFRQPNGESAVGVDTPSITGPFTESNAAQPADGTNLPDPYTTMFFYSGAPSLGAGPSLQEATSAAPLISGTSQLVHLGTPFCDSTSPPPAGFTQCAAGSPNTTTFGQSGGVFAMGLAPYNINPNTAQSYSYQPYPQPMYDNAATHQTFVPWGGPPAFDPDGNGMGTRDGLVILGNDSLTYGLCNMVPTSTAPGCPYFLGVGEGITVFEGVTPNAGSYSLAAQIGIIGNNGSKTLSTIKASATLGSVALLGNATAPVVTPDGTGGATFTATVPAGATEALVQIVDYGPGAGPTAFAGGGNYHAPNCQGPKGTSFAPVYYTVPVRSTGAYALANNHGPNNLAGGPGSLTPTPSICTAAQNTAALGTSTPGDNISVQMIGFDYPAYEAAVSLTQPAVPQTPQLTGPNGQSDITISVGEEEDAPGYAQTPLDVIRRPALRTSALRGPGAFYEPFGLHRKLGIPRQL